MKTFIHAIAIVLLSANCYSQSQAKPVNTEVTFGRYGSDCSSGRGACSFTTSKVDPDINFERNAKRISENTFVLQLNTSSLTKEEEVRIAGTVFNEVNPNEIVFFVQQSDLLLNRTTLQNLQIDPKYSQIVAGNYPMVISKEKVEITFTLKDPNELKH